MDLNLLFEAQTKLDAHIVKEKGLEGVDTFERKKVAFLCELYECINEARFFKFWSDNQKPKMDAPEMVVCQSCKGNPDIVEVCETCLGRGAYSIGRKNPLLEEYADTIHFLLSIANDIGYTSHVYTEQNTQDLNRLTLGITNLASIINKRDKKVIGMIFNLIIKLGYQLGFTEQEVIREYHKKNKINHERQENSY